MFPNNDVKLICLMHTVATIVQNMVSLLIRMWLYEGDPTDKFTQALALLLHQIYSSNWANLDALHIPFKCGYDTLISNNG